MQVLARFRPIKKTKDNKLNSREQKLRCEFHISDTCLVRKNNCYILNLINTISFSYTVAFKMYDLDNDDKVSRDELLAILHMMVGANIRYVSVCWL